MAQLRKSAVQTQAREEARKQGAEIARRHEQLTKLAEEYYAAQIEADMILDAAQKKADKALSDGKAQAASATQRSALKAKEMLDVGEPTKAVTQRLGITSAALRRLTADQQTAPETPAAAQTSQ